MLASLASRFFYSLILLILLIVARRADIGQGQRDIYEEDGTLAEHSVGVVGRRVGLSLVCVI